ncbi:MAG: ABC transporter substrate-binding protein [Acidimicrobiia bacterium]
MALISAGALVFAACGGDDDDTASTDTDASTETTAEAAETTVAGGDEETTTSAAGEEEPAGDVAMTVTMELSPDAVWDDGTPITIADLQCTMDAVINTPGSLSTVGYDKIVSIETGASDNEVVVSFSEVYAPYKNLFNPLIKAEAFEDCNDVSADMADNIPFSGREWKIDSWSPDQLILVPNENYWGPEQPTAASVVMVPKADSDTEIASLKSSESDFIFPQAYAGITEALNDPNIQYTPGYGTNYEGLYFQQRDGVFADDDFRQAFAKSVDRDLILSQIYDPIFPGGPLLQCGLWVPTIGEWCDDTIFTDYYDPEGAAQILTDAGWTKGGDGFWADPDGNVPEVKWIVNSGNSRRESTQALMIPELATAGFKVVTDNCDAACYFQQRLPALDYDLAMYINTASPDPTVTGIMSCDAVPSEENGNQGQNSTGWCNEEASALMLESDQTVDEDARIDLIHQIGQYLADDAVMLPLYQFPNIAAWRTDKLSGPIDKDAANYQAFQNIWEWVPASGDQIIIGAEQWPECLNPITECANSSWYVWTTAFKVLPGVWNTTGEGTYEPSALVTGEPVVEVLG